MSAPGPRCATSPAHCPMSPAPPRTSRSPTCCPASTRPPITGRWCSPAVTWPGSCPRPISAAPWNGSAAALARSHRPGTEPLPLTGTVRSPARAREKTAPAERPRRPTPAGRSAVGRLVHSLDGMTVATAVFRFDDSYARAVPRLSVPWPAAPAPAPELLVLNEQLAAELGADPAALREPPGVLLLVGQAPAGVTTVAQAYAGHQFGVYVPRLGDGRALLLGEVTDIHGRRRDLHLKGSGRTPFARGGDGKAAVGPMLREYLIGEAMRGLGIPTTRALAVVATGEQVLREGA